MVRAPALGLTISPLLKTSSYFVKIVNIAFGLFKFHLFFDGHAGFVGFADVLRVDVNFIPLYFTSLLFLKHGQFLFMQLILKRFI